MPDAIVRRPSLTEADGHALLFLTAGDPESGLRLRLWREKCRRESRPSIIVFEDEDKTHIEVRTYAAKEGYTDLYGGLSPKYKMTGAGGGSDSSDATLIGHYDHKELERDILEILKQPRKPLRTTRLTEALLNDDTDEDEQIAIAGFFRELDPGPAPKLHFDSQEFEVVTAAVLASSPERPIAIAQMTTPQSFGKFPSEDRLAQWPRGAYDSWEERRGDYEWEPRFGQGIRFAGEASSGLWTICSRPGIDGDSAIVQLSGYSFCGFVLLSRASGSWTVKQRSHDRDWGEAAWERTSPWDQTIDIRLPDDEWLPKFDEWSRYPIPYPCPPQRFVSPITREESHRLYDRLARGLAPSAESSTVRLCHGEPMKLVDLLENARQTRDICLNSAPSEITAQLAEEGIPVVLLDSDSPPSLAKLLAYWSRDFCVLRVDDTYTKPLAPTKDQQQVITRLATLFRKASIRGIEFGVAASYTPKFYFLPEGERLARSDHPSPFDHIGTVLAGQSSIDPRIFTPDVILRYLCEWGDPDGVYTDALMASFDGL